MCPMVLLAPLTLPGTIRINECNSLPALLEVRDLTGSRRCDPSASKGPT